MRKLALVAMVLLLNTVPATAAHQDWVIRHQPDRFIDRVMMEAWADAAKGSTRMALYCDTENGFRVMFMPRRAMMPEGPAQITLTIDSAKPVVMEGDAFGDEATDVVTVHNNERVQKALSTARHVVAQFRNGDGRQTGEDDFTFGDLAAERATLMKVCPVRR
jgi:hypothetical protein